MVFSFYLSTYITTTYSLIIHNKKLYTIPSSFSTGLLSTTVRLTFFLGDGVGNFTFEMDMFEDPKYDIVVSQYPINVRPDQTMYFQVNVKSRDRRLVAFLEECWVTPTTNPRDQTRYTIIERG